MKTFSVQTIQTPIFHIGDDLVNFIASAVAKDLVNEKMILAITSKIVSLAENCLAPACTDKKQLVEAEADLYLGEIGYGCHLTIKNNLLIPSAGIDESNSESGDFILYPKDAYQSARHIWQKLRRIWNIKELGILLTDSHTTPLRRGVTGICLSYWGFHGVRSMIGTQDLFGRELKMTQLNFADGLAASAVMQMGEGQECQPLAVLLGSQVEFCDEISVDELQMPLKDDLYFPLLKTFLDI